MRVVLGISGASGAALGLAAARLLARMGAAIELVVTPMAERTLREVAHAGTWAEQRSAWRKLSASGTRP